LSFEKGDPGELESRSLHKGVKGKNNPRELEDNKMIFAENICQKSQSLSLSLSLSRTHTHTHVCMYACVLQGTTFWTFLGSVNRCVSKVQSAMFSFLLRGGQGQGQGRM
jgi:hypothetical protein